MNYVIAKIKYRVFPFIILNIICLIFLYKEEFKANGFLPVLIVNLFVLFYYSTNKSIYQIDFEDKFIDIKYKQFWRKGSMYVSYQNLAFTFKKALVGRGVTDNVIDLFEYDTRIARIHPSSTEFGYDDMDKIIVLLKEKGVTQIE